MHDVWGGGFTYLFMAVSQTNSKLGGLRQKPHLTVLVVCRLGASLGNS